MSRWLGTFVVSFSLRHDAKVDGFWLGRPKARLADDVAIDVALRPSHEVIMAPPERHGNELGRVVTRNHGVAVLERGNAFVGRPTWFQWRSSHPTPFQA